MCSNQLAKNKTIVLLGMQEVGKSSILRRYVKNRYQECYKETIGIHINYYKGVDYYTKNISGKSSKLILSIWDTNGDEINKKILPANIYINSSAFLIVCSYDKKESLDFLIQLISFIEKILNNKSTNNFRNVPIMILINKCDIKINRKFKFYDVMKKIEGSVCRFSIHEVSAKDNIKINYVFNQLIKLTTDKLLWTNETIETTKFNMNETTEACSVNKWKRSFIIEKSDDYNKQKCRKDCCK